MGECERDMGMHLLTRHYWKYIANNNEHHMGANSRLQDICIQLTCTMMVDVLCKDDGVAMQLIV